MTERPTGPELRAEIDAYRELTGMSAEDFGLHIGKGKTFVTMLRFTAQPRAATVDIVRTFIAAYPAGIGPKEDAALLLAPDLRAGLVLHARRRNITVNQIATRLLSTIVSDKMVDAVLDDG